MKDMVHKDLLLTTSKVVYIILKYIFSDRRSPEYSLDTFGMYHLALAFVDNCNYLVHMFCRRLKPSSMVHSINKCRLTTTSVKQHKCPACMICR